MQLVLNEKEAERALRDAGSIPGSTPLNYVRRTFLFFLFHVKQINDKIEKLAISLTVLNNLIWLAGKLRLTPVNVHLFDKT